ncbi:ATP-binding protein [Elusimicrobiota bacterium]
MKSKLFTRTAILLLALTLIPLMIVGFVQLEIVRRALGKDFENVKIRLAQNVGEEAASFINSVANLLYTLSEIDDYYDFNRKEYSSLGERIFNGHSAITAIAIYDIAGTRVFTREKGGGFGFSSSDATLSSYIKAEILRTGKYKSRAIRVLANYPSIDIYVPIRIRQTRKVAGYVHGAVSLRDISKNLSKIQLGATAEFFIVDQKNRLIAHSNYRQVTSKNEGQVVDPEISSIIQKIGPYKNWAGRITLSNGRDVIAAIYKFSEPKWLSCIIQDRWEAFAVMTEMRQRLAEAMLVVMAVVLITALFFANKISHPIRALTLSLRQIAASGFTHPTKDKLPKPPNEIGELAQTIETMSFELADRTKKLLGAQEELKSLNLELEARVEARTKELKATQGELIKQERLAAIGQMASVIGHELRNPLAVINNSTYVIKSRLNTAASQQSPASADPKLAKHIHIVESELVSANQIISEILTFARTREIQPRDIEINEFVEDILMRMSVPEGVNLVKNYASEPVRVRVDPDEIRQAVRNLLGNACEAMPAGGTLTIETRINSSHALLTIEDTGMGIEKTAISKIFTPFFSTKNKGTGLGLAVVKRVVDRHNGNVEVESTVGKGTKFILRWART